MAINPEGRHTHRMPRYTKAEENPPWSPENKNTEYYHSHEIRSLKNLRETLESIVGVMEKQKEHYELSNALISQSLIEQIVALTNNIYDEQLTRDAAGRPTEHSFIALKKTKD